MHTPFFKLFNCSTVQLFGLTKLSHSILTFGRVCFRSGKFKQARLSSRLLADFNLQSSIFNLQSSTRPSSAQSSSLATSEA